MQKNTELKHKMYCLQIPVQRDVASIQTGVSTANVTVLVPDTTTVVMTTNLIVQEVCISLFVPYIVTVAMTTRLLFRRCVYVIACSWLTQTFLNG